jgi:hypothetical protein
LCRFLCFSILSLTHTHTHTHAELADMISEIQLGSDAYTHCLTGMQEACELQRQANLDMAAPLVKETRAYSDERRVCVCV